ncbi:MAG: hypothetical protein Q8O00_12550, partial [Holophaga sp.]|nr:hypothetical protein [Holophaga sp.]
VFLHEVGHVCKLEDHEGAAPKGFEDAARECLMFLQGGLGQMNQGWGRKRTLVHTALGRGDADFAYPYRTFCSTVKATGYHCSRSLDVKDE